jgi:coproporphyrinogen III oxidase-like Fe-S oxidoreductase
MDIFSELAKHFTISKDAEITIEANPDDLSLKNEGDLKNEKFNNRSSSDLLLACRIRI